MKFNQEINVFLGKLANSVIVVDVIKEEDVHLCVRVKVPERGGALLHIQGPSLKDVHDRKSFGRAEAGVAVVNDAVGADVFCCYLVNTAAAQ